MARQAVSKPKLFAWAKSKAMQEIEQIYDEPVNSSASDTQALPADEQKTNPDTKEDNHSEPTQAPVADSTEKIPAESTKEEHKEEDKEPETMDSLVPNEPETQKEDDGKKEHEDKKEEIAPKAPKRKIKSLKSVKSNKKTNGIMVDVDMDDYTRLLLLKVQTGFTLKELVLKAIHEFVEENT